MVEEWFSGKYNLPVFRYREPCIKSRISFLFSPPRETDRGWRSLLLGRDLVQSSRSPVRAPTTMRPTRLAAGSWAMHPDTLSLHARCRQSQTTHRLDPSIRHEWIARSSNRRSSLSAIRSASRQGAPSHRDQASTSRSPPVLEGPWLEMLPSMDLAHPCSGRPASTKRGSGELRAPASPCVPQRRLACLPLRGLVSCAHGARTAASSPRSMR